MGLQSVQPHRTPTPDSERAPTWTGFMLGLRLCFYCLKIIIYFLNMCFLSEVQQNQGAYVYTEEISITSSSLPSYLYIAFGCLMTVKAQ